VRLPDGTQAERHIWQVRNADELARERLFSRLSRSGAKETTLDYERAAYAERRGIDISSEIIVPERARQQPEAAREQVMAPGRDDLVSRARDGLEASRAAWGEHHGTFSAGRFANRQAERQAERALAERLPGLAKEVGRQAEGLARAAEGLDGLGERIAAQAKARQQSPSLTPEAGKEKGPELGREVEAPAARPERKRGMFDGLKLSTGRVMRPEASRDAPVHSPEAARERGPERAVPPLHRDRETLTRAVDRYARAWSDAKQMQDQDLPILEQQKAALRDAGVGLDAVRPGALQDLRAALRYEPDTYRAMVQMQGQERAAQLAAGIAREGRVWREPELKAGRLVKMWNELDTERASLRGWDQAEARGKIEARMKDLAFELKRDPQLESLVRSRSRELGIAAGSSLDRVMRERERDIGQAIDHSFRRSRGPSLGM
jgi:hypothetical protein